MRIRNTIVSLAASLVATLALAADAPNAAPPKAAATTGAQAPIEADSPRQMCIKQCEQNNGICNTDVRASKRDCEKQAANRGNNPFLGRPDFYDGYCGYFGGDHCGYFSNRGQCSNRYARRYAECVEWMRGNIASQRYECFRAESQAQKLCRAELRDCKTQCE